MKELRTVLGFVFGFWLVLGIAGASYMFVGEWDARRKLPSEMRTPEAIHKLYDDAVCLDCSGGGVLVVVSILFGAGVLFIGMLIEVINHSVTRRPHNEERSADAELNNNSF